MRETQEYYLPEGCGNRETLRERRKLFRDYFAIIVINVFGRGLFSESSAILTIVFPKPGIDPESGNAERAVAFTKSFCLLGGPRSRVT